MATELITDGIPRDFAAFKGRKAPDKEEKPAASEPKGEKPAKASDSESGKTSETAGDSETPKAQEQPKRHDADDRVRILTKRQKEMEEKHDRELRERDEKHERELAEIRKLLVTKVAAPSEPQPKTEAAPAPEKTNEPDWDAFLANAPKDEPLGKTITRFNREHIAWLNAQERQKSQRDTTEQARQAKINDAYSKHGREKVDAALGTRENPMSGVALANGVIPFLAQYDNWVDVLVHLQDNPAEYRRIFQMPAQQQLGEVVFLARTLAASPAKDDERPPLEKPKPSAPPTSRIPAPMRVVGGTEAATPKTTADASSFGSFKKVSRYSNRRGA